MVVTVRLMQDYQDERGTLIPFVLLFVRQDDKYLTYIYIYMDAALTAGLQAVGDRILVDRPGLPCRREHDWNMSKSSIPP